MAVKNFVFRKNWVGSEVAGMKMAFFTIFEPTWTLILDSKDQNIELLTQNFNFQLFRKTEAILLPNMPLTKVETLKIIIFCHF